MTDLLSNPTGEFSARRLVLVAVVMGLAAAAVLVVTSPGLPMVWDEGVSIRRAEGISHWVGRWFGQDNNPAAPLATDPTPGQRSGKGDSHLLCEAP
ncbi:MAG: hypothetical protein JW818_10770, partial [Pirellulales bacterium]|nr:hypothetical protein [Pirellulales bacterium]